MTVQEGETMIGPLCEAWVIDNWRMLCTHGSCDEIVTELNRTAKP